jgi:hypothetical protein
METYLLLVVTRRQRLVFVRVEWRRLFVIEVDGLETRRPLEFDRGLLVIIEVDRVDAGRPCGE